MFYLLEQPTDEEFQEMDNRYEEMNPSSVKATVTLLKAGSDLLTGFEQLLKRYGLSQGRFLILIVMNRKPDIKTTPSILARQVGVTKATMTGLIDGLEKSGLIKRYHHAQDRRKQDLLLTKAGKDLLAKVLPDYWSRIRDLMEDLSESEEMLLVNLLAKITNRLSYLTD
ncbi:MarR family winged helix-turn-helix transcriptional regulator [Maridesulfovibrio zosterae]|uniref:MarR family winged helix-turn-helix transcriptional regulator n=1 Tax=Maridesulfovibrio zosterae TaxID=82171 RepID=UPI0004246352|nr:MarR family transcriptional regulator [Maridesulfovibrio zosterae]